MSYRLVVGFLALAACAPSVTTVPLNPNPRPLARSAISVEIFAAGQPPAGYVEVALIEATARRGDTKMPELVAVVRRRAAELGCDGLVLIGPRTTEGDEGLSTMCIAFTPPRQR
jgi:hypothetical protein